MTTTTINIRAAFEQIFGPTDWDTPTPFADAIEPPEPDLYVSESEAAHRQRAVDDRLGEIWGPR